MAFLLSDVDHDALRRLLAWFRGLDPSELDTAGQSRTWQKVPTGDWQRQIFLAKTTASHTKGTTQAVDLYGKLGEAQGSETKLTDGAGNDAEIDVYNRFADVPADKWVLCAAVSGGYEMIAAEC